ncbi:MAG TPA: hypothetical protein VN613_02035 [Gemmatimonadaceae bacterium]|nr:hypothetical protein [Gemmatimonadaceae bacterium]
MADIIVMTDYGSPQQAASDGSSPPNKSENRVRIEMEIPNCGDSALQTSLSNGDLEGAFEAILTAKGYWPIPTTIDSVHARGLAVLAAALGKFDGIMPPANKPSSPPVSRKN